MKIFYNQPDPFTYNSVCAIGNFDGIHRGHQKIIKRLKTRAGKDRTGIITFNPQPVSVLTPNGIIFLTTKEEKEEIIKSLGIDFIYYFKFDENFSRISPEEFVALLAGDIKPKTVIVGENFHFGKDRVGDVSMLKELAKGRFSVEIIPIIKDINGIISSTRIRELLLLGHIPSANRLLGREYSLTGYVIKGKGKGREFGFPTVNIRVEKEKLLPLDGVYGVKLEIDNKDYKGAMFLSHQTIEVYIINFSGNLYDRKLTVKFLKRLRAIKEFPDAWSLKEAIGNDIKMVLADLP